MSSTRRTPVLSLFVLASAALSALAQENSGPATVDGLPLGRWLPVDGVAVVVNSDPITERGLLRRVERRAHEFKITTMEQYRELYSQTVMDQVDTLLMRQAGEDLGFPKDAIEAYIADQIDDRKEEAGGIYDLSRSLRDDAQTREDLSGDLETKLYEDTFKRRILGIGGSAERSAEDRYVRPGVVARQYRHIRRTGIGIQPLSRVGASPALYELQALLLDPTVYGSMEAAGRAAQEARAALVEGVADWDKLIDTIGALPNRGLTGPQAIENLRFGLDPGDNRLVQFIMEGRQDVYSEVMPYPRVNPVTGERQVEAFAIYRLLGREPAKLPAYGAPGIQTTLRRVLEGQADDARLDSALNHLKSSAYIWYLGIEADDAARAERQAEFERKVLEDRERNAELLRQGRGQRPPKRVDEGRELPLDGDAGGGADGSPGEDPPANGNTAPDGR